MSKFVIETQIRENYASHDSDWDGVSEYWKNKGGNTYIVEAETAEEAKTVIPLVTDFIKKVDKKNRIVFFQLPDGLIDLNNNS